MPLVRVPNGGSSFIEPQQYLISDYSTAANVGRLGTFAKNTYYPVKQNSGTWGASCIVNVSNISSGSLVIDGSASGIHTAYVTVKNGVIASSTRYGTFPLTVNFSDVDYIFFTTTVGGSGDTTKFKITWT